VGNSTLIFQLLTWVEFNSNRVRARGSIPWISTPKVTYYLCKEHGSLVTFLKCGPYHFILWVLYLKGVIFPYCKGTLFHSLIIEGEGYAVLLQIAYFLSYSMLECARELLYVKRLTTAFQLSAFLPTCFHKLRYACITDSEIRLYVNVTQILKRAKTAIQQNLSFK